MSGEIILGIDNLSLIFLCVLIALELYAFVSENDVLLIVWLGLIILLYAIRIRNRRNISTK